ncbi:hypothetical protein SNEBB_007731 [Seison nebaliae]|nr:hypothetical protein SNEBB_007731 [Seison nebaliae]
MDEENDDLFNFEKSTFANVCRRKLSPVKVLNKKSKYYHTTHMVNNKSVEFEEKEQIRIDNDPFYIIKFTSSRIRCEYKSGNLVEFQEFNNINDVQCSSLNEKYLFVTCTDGSFHYLELMNEKEIRIKFSVNLKVNGYFIRCNPLLPNFLLVFSENGKVIVFRYNPEELEEYYRFYLYENLQDIQWNGYGKHFVCVTENCNLFLIDIIHRTIIQNYKEIDQQQCCFVRWVLDDSFLLMSTLDLNNNSMVYLIRPLTMNGELSLTDKHFLGSQSSMLKVNEYRFTEECEVLSLNYIIDYHIVMLNSTKLIYLLELYDENTLISEEKMKLANNNSNIQLVRKSTPSNIFHSHRTIKDSGDFENETLDSLTLTSNISTSKSLTTRTTGRKMSIIRQTNSGTEDIEKKRSKSSNRRRVSFSYLEDKPHSIPQFLFLPTIENISFENIFPVQRQSDDQNLFSIYISSVNDQDGNVDNDHVKYCLSKLEFRCETKNFDLLQPIRRSNFFGKNDGMINDWLNGKCEIQRLFHYIDMKSI